MFCADIPTPRVTDWDLIISAERVSPSAWEGKIFGSDEHWLLSLNLFGYMKQ